MLGDLYKWKMSMRVNCFLKKAICGWVWDHIIKKSSFCYLYTSTQSDVNEWRKRVE